MIRKSFDVYHIQNILNNLVDFIKSLNGDTKAVFECTDYYHRLIVETLHRADIFVFAVNPCLIKNLGYNTINTVKIDSADVKKIAWYVLDNFYELIEYSVMNSKREQ